MTNPYSRRSFLSKGAAGAVGLSLFANFANDLFAAVQKQTLYSAPSDLKITDIKCGYIRGGHSLFVKVFSNQDIVGHGEAVDATPGTYHLVKMMGERIKGQNPLNMHRIFEDVRRRGFFEGAQSGMYIAVLTAIETALWDMAGKALNLPVYQLLGGKFRDNIRVYMDTALYQSDLPSPQEFADSAKEAVDMGMTAVKFDLDQFNDPNKYDRYNWTASPGELQRMYDQIAAAREAVGPNIDICVDMHGKYDLPTGKKVAKMMEPLNLMWLEEPIPAENLEAYKLITESTSTPICTGENLYLAHPFRRLLELGAVDIIMPDLQKAGGLGEAQRIANLANLYYVPFAPHMVASYLGAMAAAHVCASVPNFLILEWQIYFHKNPMFKEIVDFEGDMVVDGYIPLLEKPGIGVEINEEGMRKYADKDVPFFT
ncbi:mandelate racemase/muconate lactonizing enzyme family protein [Catalinimonas niigatensis]|uniref:mandelate racemase/muconate lactonizing enzyme family protein n=1 Tax=Catalinimonas niigatensis TaxID=1397264 RepID=UPI0026670582|nr:mandelate racemase/muconate lactonizing enzyme family protein [Catalinimonas niigatensis]WPP50507.1 mandelate racemase/muconate lactonizing enzyme family protein [Catalinimonas niigatensis]